MNQPVHHPPDEYVLGYASGTLEEGESVIVATHAALCPLCARRLRELEAMGGALLRSGPSSDVAPDLLARTLARLPPQQARSRPAPRPVDAVLPAPLLHYTGPLESIPWKRAYERVWFFDLPLTVQGAPVRLRRFGPGLAIPAHTHRGPELELILSGGATDDRDGRRFARGDLAYNDEQDAHSLTIDDDGPCLTLGLHQGRLKPLGLRARVVLGYLGW